MYALCAMQPLSEKELEAKQYSYRLRQGTSKLP